MRNKFERYGYWWLPNEEDNKIAGILSYTPNEHPKLKLIGSFMNGEDLWQDVMNPEISTLPNLIFGKDADGKKITLIVADRSGSWNDSSGLPIVDYTIQHCLIGIHLSSWDDKVFYKISIELPMLTYWMNHFPLRHSYSAKEKKASGFDLSYNAEVNLHTYELKSGIKFNIKHYACPPKLYTQSSIMQQKYFVELETVKRHNILFFLKMGCKRRSN